MPGKFNRGGGGGRGGGNRGGRTGGIVHGLSDLVNLDATSSPLVPATPTNTPTTAPSVSFKKPQFAYSQPQQKPRQEKRNDQPSSQQQQQQQPQQQHQYYAQNKDLQAPPEARLPRWTLVHRQLFPAFTKGSQALSDKKRASAHSAAISGINEALLRIERWRRTLASHGMLLRLRKLPPYIEATKALIDAVQSDRQLERMRDEQRAQMMEKEDEEEELQQQEEADDDDDNDAEKKVVDDGGIEDSDFDDDGSEWSAESLEGSIGHHHHHHHAAKNDQAVNQVDDEEEDDSNNSLRLPLISQFAPVNSSSAASLLSASTLPMIYATAISRAVFEMTESGRKFSDQLDERSTFRSRAQAIALPEELVEARNQIAHGRMPTLAQMRFAVSMGLQYLYQQQWAVRAAALKEFRKTEEEHKQQQQRQQAGGSAKGGFGAMARRQQEQQQQSQSQSGNKKGDRRRQRDETNAAPATAAAAKVPTLSLAELQKKVAQLQGTTSKK